MRRACPIELTDDERETLTRWSRGRSTPARLVLRSRIVLRAAAGEQNTAIAAALGTDAHTAARWRTRFAALRLVGLEKDAPRPGRPAGARQAVAAEIVRKTTRETPPGATQWSTRTMAAAVGTSPATVQRVWSAAGLKPHLVETFKVSGDPQFAEKLIDVVGLYLDPPEHALVLSCDEKSQIQALDRTQKSLPLFPGRRRTLTHDYRRHGTTTLFAAIDTAQGLVISDCKPRHRHQEWLEFLRQIDRATDPELDLHLIVDNYATHKHPKVRAWLGRHPRFHVHFTPTSSSWLNVIERWFRDLTVRRLRRGSFRSVPALKAAIRQYVDQHNNDPRPFRWTAKAEVILAKVRRARAVLDNVRSG